MVGTALFYGQDQSTLWLDITASFITSLFGKLPQFVVRHIFIKSEPRKTDSTKMQRTNSISRRRVSIQRRRSSVSPVVASAVNSPRFQQVSDIRMKLYRKKYKYATYCREVAWCILLMFAIFCCFAAILFGLSFDLHVESSRNKNNPNADLYASDCWTTSLHLRIEDDLSVDYFDAVYAKREELNGSSYGGSDARSWLLSLGQSLLLSLFFWQPLLTYIVTWIKLWMFTWHLEMKVLFICCLHLFILIQINYVHK